MSTPPEDTAATDTPAAGTHSSRLYSRRDALGLGAMGLGAVALLSACGSGGGDSGGGGGVQISLATGISYAPLNVMRAKGWLEKALPHHQISWKTINGGSTTRDGLLSGSLQAGASGVGPYLIGWDAGVPWKIITSLNDMPLWLMVKDPRIKSLKDFGPQDRIAAVAPGSIESVVLEKGALQQLGNAHALDHNIASLPHPQALQSLEGGSVAGDLTSPPFEFEEQAKGARKLLDSYQLFGPHSFNIMAALESYAKDNPDVIKAVYQNVSRANDYLTKNPKDSAKILSKAAGGKPSPADFEKYITHKDIVWTTTPHGLMTFAKFMKQINVIKKTPSSWKDLVFHTVSGANGS